MSTNDVPGADPKNGDELRMGCWAEHDDGSLIFVMSTEADRVIYSIFDMVHEVQYQDAMTEDAFKKYFTWDPSKKGTSPEKWTWHDKTPFPWNKVIKEGFHDGPLSPSAAHTLTAAEKVAKSLKLRASAIDKDMMETHGHRLETVVKKKGGIFSRLGELLDREFGRGNDAE